MIVKRLVCRGCGRPQSVCLCAALQPRGLPPGLTLMILQDKHEARHPLSTAPLLQRSFPDSRLLVGEVFSADEVLGDTALANTALLYPLTHKPALAAEHYADVRCLIVLDGTWRKVKKMLLNNPWLTDLPHLALQPQQPGRYAIRTSPRADGVSTLEATVLALNALHPAGQYDKTLTVLDLLVQQQLQFGHKKP
ncbi:DTW domain-containing protein [Oceanospirillaceae bacterium ASx5O]|nr:DTW domain-containing protein [Oceanospirillaceae bacterium ASx5O]